MRVRKEISMKAWWMCSFADYNPIIFTEEGVQKTAGAVQTLSRYLWTLSCWKSCVGIQIIHKPWDFTSMQVSWICLYRTLDGQTPVSQRQQIVDGFNSKYSFILFFVKFKADGVDLTLLENEVANYVQLRNHGTVAHQNLCPGFFTRVLGSGCHFLLQGAFWLRIKPWLSRILGRQLYHLSHQGGSHWFSMTLIGIQLLISRQCLWVWRDGQKHPVHIFLNIPPNYRYNRGKDLSKTDQ